MTRLNWKLVSVRLEIVLIMTQDRCAVCAERTIGSEIILDMVLVSVQDRCMVCAKHTMTQKRTRWYSKVMRLNWKLISVHLEIVLIFTQDRCTVCTERTIGSEIILDALDGTPR